jgi:hypothetical protein
MPFAAEFNGIYASIGKAVQSALPTEPLRCLRLDEMTGAGRISERLVRELSESHVCLADITGMNPNVMWEVGYAMALDQPTLLISGDPPQSLPFDLKDMQTVFYNRDNLEATLLAPLGAALRHTLAEYGARSSSRRIHLVQKTEFTMSVTGSKQAHKHKIVRSLELLLQPYFGANPTWFVGSWGATDEAAIEFLVKNGQRCTIVGHDEFDISPTALELIEKHDLKFMPASAEQLPGISGGRPRDVLFLMRADIVCLLWNRRSNRVKDLIKWYRDLGKSHMVGFVGSQ